MRFPVLDDYLRRLPAEAGTHHRLWRDGPGQVHGTYFNCALTSVFQPVRRLAGAEPVGYEAFVRSTSEDDAALSIWKLLEGAASDDESIALDRLCRMLHGINFFRQSPGDSADLYLSVHERLLAAVSGSHGVVFRRVLVSLGLPIDRIVLQMPPARPGQQFLLSYVADNYRRSGFRVALNALDVADALRLLDRITPDVLKLDAREISSAAALDALAARCRLRGTVLLLKQVECAAVASAAESARFILAQGHAWDRPEATLTTPNEKFASDRGCADGATRARRPGEASALLRNR